MLRCLIAWAFTVMVCAPGPASADELDTDIPLYWWEGQPPPTLTVLDSEMLERAERTGKDAGISYHRIRPDEPAVFVVQGPGDLRVHMVFDRSPDAPPFDSDEVLVQLRDSERAFRVVRRASRSWYVDDGSLDAEGIRPSYPVALTVPISDTVDRVLLVFPPGIGGGIRVVRGMRGEGLPPIFLSQSNDVDLDPIPVPVPIVAAPKAPQDTVAAPTEVPDEADQIFPAPLVSIGLLAGADFPNGNLGVTAGGGLSLDVLLPVPADSAWLYQRFDSSLRLWYAPRGQSRAAVVAGRGLESNAAQLSHSGVVVAGLRYRFPFLLGIGLEPYVGGGIGLAVSGTRTSSFGQERTDGNAAFAGALMLGLDYRLSRWLSVNLEGAWVRARADLASRLDTSWAEDDLSAFHLGFGLALKL